MGKKSKLTAQQTKTSKLTLSCFFSEHLCSRNRRKINAGRRKQKTNPPSSTVIPSTDSLFSSLFFERTDNFGHVPVVRLQVLDDFSTACAWTVSLMKAAHKDRDERHLYLFKFAISPALSKQPTEKSNAHMQRRNPHTRWLGATAA